MSPERFEHLLGIVAPFFSKKGTCLFTCISAAERLVLPFQFLTTGNVQQSLSFHTNLVKVQLVT